MSSNGYVKPGEDPPPTPPASASTTCSRDWLEKALCRVLEAALGSERDREEAARLRSENAQLRIERDDAILSRGAGDHLLEEAIEARDVARRERADTLGWLRDVVAALDQHGEGRSRMHPKLVSVLQGAEIHISANA